MLHLKKSLGQNLLINRGVLDKIVNTAELNKGDVVLEIGPGTGILTEKLVEKVSPPSSRQAGRVIAVEKDHYLVELLKNKFSTKSTNSAIAEVVDININNINIIRGDALKFNPTRYLLTPNSYNVVGNIPYYITSHLLKTIFEKWPMPKLIVLTVQKEVAQRIIAKPPKMNLLALSVQFYAEPKIISYVSRGSFRPTPKVDSAILRLKPKNNLQLTTYNRQQFFKLIKKAFAGKRKQLKNTIGLEVLREAGIRPEARPEELALEDWLKISSKV